MARYKVLDGRVVRAIDVPSSLLDSSLGQDPVMTNLVLGMPQGALPGMKILGRVDVRKQHFRYPVFGAEHLQPRDTERGLKERIQSAGIKIGYENASLKRFSFAYDFDDDELSENTGDDIGSVLRLQQRGTFEARQTVELNLEKRRHTLLTTVTNYPVANRLAIAGGSEWDAAGGDSKTDVQAMANQVVLGTPYTREQVSVFLSDEAKEAALADPIFIAARANYTTDMSDLDTLRKYWGVGEVWTAKPVTSADGTLANVVGMYADLAIVYLPPEISAPSGISLPELTSGTPRFGAAFAMNDGVALRPYYEEDRTTWFYPWQARDHSAIIQSARGAIITNCKA
jgi:hypothetical protein